MTDGVPKAVRRREEVWARRTGTSPSRAWNAEGTANEELAALTVVLPALGAGRAPARRGRPVDGSRRWRGPRACRGPRGRQ
ncbi:acyl-CoA carboxylase epsilon subunit [Streptomyces sp. NPDC059466]|uniref:acyl-CoA carboxylase epsilon subunit n=1 Tax=Streptomyces sp. NPDC059466 TaxID=3346843 RepID=UPI0036A34E6A